jgi:Glycosyltransferase
MSQANADYVIIHNPEVNQSIVEVCPNSVEVVDKSVDYETKKQVREKYGIPLYKKVLIYGGNLGKPQGIPFLIECLQKCEDITDAYFLIVGDGTEYHLLSDFVERDKPSNVKLMKRLPKEDYDTMVGACDVGLIFLDHRFTIPNFSEQTAELYAGEAPCACSNRS